jgi:uncharacterized protein YaiI (UPF0178 family)
VYNVTIAACFIISHGATAAAAAGDIYSKKNISFSSTFRKFMILFYSV